MKTANILSLSAFIVVSGMVVGCSAPPAGEAKDKSASAQGDDDETKAAPSKPAPAGTTSAPAGTTKGTTTPAKADGGPDACLTCVGATTKAGLSVKCAATCKEDDDACFTKCETDHCGAGAAACKADFDKCSVQCFGPQVTPDQEAKYQACIAKFPKAKAFSDCDAKCNDAACGEKCWTDSKCDEQCDIDMDKCAAEAGIPQGG